jgi:hypothetical protein
MFGNFAPVTATINSLISDMPEHAPRVGKH